MISLQPFNIVLTKDSRAARVVYVVNLTTNSFAGPVGNGETEIATDEVQERIDELFAAVERALNAPLGLNTQLELPIAVVSSRDEDPL